MSQGPVAVVGLPESTVALELELTELVLEAEVGAEDVEDDERLDDEVFAEDELPEDGLPEDEVSSDELVPVDAVAPDAVDVPEPPAAADIELLEPVVPPPSDVPD